MSEATPPKICSKAKCKRPLPAVGYKFATCEKCREQNSKSMAKKRAQLKAQDVENIRPPLRQSAVISEGQFDLIGLITHIFSTHPKYCLQTVLKLVLPKIIR